jgi:hypothetical protein
MREAGKRVDRGGVEVRPSVAPLETEQLWVTRWGVARMEGLGRSACKRVGRAAQTSRVAVSAMAGTGEGAAGGEGG